MMGLLWIAFMGFDNSIFKSTMSLKDLTDLISEQNLTQYPIPMKLLNLKDYPDMTIEETLIQFQEEFILGKGNQNKDTFNDSNNDFEDLNQGPLN